MKNNIVSVIRGNIDHTNSMLDFFDEFTEGLIVNAMEHTLYCYEPNSSNVDVTNYGKAKVIVAKSNHNYILVLLYFIVFCAKAKPSILIGHYSLPMSLVTIASFLLRIPAIGVIHTPPNEKDAGNFKDRFKAKFYNLVLKKIIVVSEGTKKSALRLGLAEESLKRIYHGIDCCRYVSSIPPTDIKIETYQRPVFLLPAALVPIKNHLFLLEAISRIRDQSFTVLLAGDGPLKTKMVDMVNKLGIGDKVSLIGQRKDLKAITQNVDCVLLLSNKEGLGRVILEAMCFKKPVICTNVDGINEAVIDYVNGRLVENNNVDQLVDCLNSFINREEDWFEMGENGYGMANGEFHIKKTITEYIGLVKLYLKQ